LNKLQASVPSLWYAQVLQWLIAVDGLQSWVMLRHSAWDPHDWKLWLPEIPPLLLLSSENDTSVMHMFRDSSNMQ
jgi:hypothetical protein